MGWLLGQFGKDRFNASNFVVASKEFFPDKYDQSELAARALFRRTCEWMHIDPADVKLEFYQPTHRPGLARSLVRPSLDWAGLFQLSAERNVVRVDVTLLTLPESLLAVYAHELAHQLLLGSKRICPDDRDHELVTDLTVGFFGMGVLNANEALTNSYRLDRRGEERGRLGYLTPTIWGYALALCAWLREEEKPAWANWLRPRVRRVFRRCLSHLRRTQDAEVVEGGQFAESERIELLKVEYPEFAKAEPDGFELNAGSQIEDAATEDDDSAAPHEDPVVLLVEAAQHIEAGEWESACRCLDAALEIEPDNGAACQQRALVLLELDLFDEAMRDAQAAVRLEPDDSESYLARGAAYVKVRQYELAIDDLTRYLDEEDYRSAAGRFASRGYYLRGLAYAGLRDFSRAVKEYGLAINRWPDWPEPYEARAEAHEFLGHSQLARNDREQARRRATP